MYEDAGVVHELSIVKIGNSEPNITIRVQVIQDSGDDAAQIGKQLHSQSSYCVLIA